LITPWGLNGGVFIHEYQVVDFLWEEKYLTKYIIFEYAIIPAVEDPCFRDYLPFWG
jgi:hypothetical protein